MNQTQFESNYASSGGGWYFANGVAALTSPYFVSNTGTLGYRDMHRAAGIVTFETSCPVGQYFFGKDVLDCYDCSSVYYPKDMRNEGCMPWTSYETAGTQDELESAIMFDRTVELTADLSLNHAVAILGFESLTGVVIDGATYTVIGCCTILKFASLQFFTSLVGLCIFIIPSSPVCV